MVKVYVAGLYLEQKSSDANAIIKADAPKRIVLRFAHSASKNQMTDAFTESFNDNTPDAMKTMKPDIDKLLGAIDAVKVGDQMIFTYVPGSGTTFAQNGQDKVTIPGAAFGQVMFSVWLGPKPPTQIARKNCWDSNELTTDHWLLATAYFARNSNTGTLMLCCTRVAVVPRKMSWMKRCPCVLIATRSHPFSCTHRMIYVAESP